MCIHSFLPETAQVVQQNQRFTDNQQMRPLTPEQIAAQAKANADAKAKAGEQKRVAAARALQANQEAAAKGVSFGLLRMGQRYRDGDGVEKDLSKAKEYLQKAADAGSPTAAEELAKLKP
jgi:TPR repeat protein